MDYVDDGLLAFIVWRFCLARSSTRVVDRKGSANGRLCESTRRRRRQLQSVLESIRRRAGDVVKPVRRPHHHSAVEHADVRQRDAVRAHGHDELGALVGPDRTQRCLRHGRRSRSLSRHDAATRRPRKQRRRAGQPLQRSTLFVVVMLPNRPQKRTSQL